MNEPITEIEELTAKVNSMKSQITDNKRVMLYLY